MKFMLISTHIDQIIGYSKVSYNLLKQLSTLYPKVKTYHFGFQRHPSRSNLSKYPSNILSYDAAANEDPKEDGFGFNKVQEYIDTVDPDVVMIYNDPLVIHRFLESIDLKKSTYKVWLYLDQVYEGIPPSLLQKMCEHVHRVYCFSDFWKTVFLNYKIISDVRVLEHAVDNEVYHKLQKIKKEAFKVSMNIPKDAIVILNANRNSQRKRLDLTIQGFVRYLSKNPNVYLLLLTHNSHEAGAYYDVGRIYIEELKVHNMDKELYAKHMVVIDSSAVALNDTKINEIYNAADIGINTSDGEGFGLCQLEHLYTGAPQIVTDVGTYRTFLNEDVATFIKPLWRYYFMGSSPQGLWYHIFNPQDVCDAIERSVLSLETQRRNAESYTFKSWESVCSGFLKDLTEL